MNREACLDAAAELETEMKHYTIMMSNHTRGSVWWVHYNMKGVEAYDKRLTIMRDLRQGVARRVGWS